MLGNRGAEIYSFIFEIEEHYAYYFKTDNAVIYHVKLVASDYLFKKEAPYSANAYEFIITVEDNPTGEKLKSDEKIPFTIEAIFDDFYSRFSETIVIYICDSSDAKQLVRQRKFAIWFWSLERYDFFQLDTAVFDKEGIPIAISLIVKRDNRYFRSIIEEFQEAIRLNNKYSS